jgi:hypothetical protein
MELYKEDLDLLTKLLPYVEDIAGENNVYEVEVRVRLFEGDTWAVLGYGEAGDPCVLRFEEDPKPVEPVYRINPFTINKDNILGATDWNTLRGGE